MDRLTSLAVFVKAVEAGSFAAAAEALEMSSQLVGKHVRLLEDRLGVRLINRTTRRQSVTDFGKTFYERSRNILAELEAAETLADESRAMPRGRIKINAPVTFGAYELAQALPDYLARYPDVSVELTLADRIVDLIDEGYDVAFRIGPLADSTLIVRSLRPYMLTLCAAPSYLAKHGTPQIPDDLRAHECLGFAYSGVGSRWTFEGSDGIVSIDVRSRFVTNNGQAVLSAALAGLGLILQPSILVRGAIADGLLVPLLPEHVSPPRPMHLLYAPDRRMTPKLRSFIDFAVEKFDT